jgi:Hypothetical glycosyl hydrolase 6
MRKPKFDYLKCQRQILVDMHVPDWDPGFLANFDPVRMVNLYQKSGAQAVMHYCNSHMGLCYWPCSVGEMNKVLKGRDVVGETVTELHRRGMASCAYYSCIFNNWAWTNHPDWRMVSADEVVGRGEGTRGSRYGTCCFNSEGYNDFMRQQTDELTKKYEFDAIFFDMIYWPRICLCENCKRRFRQESGADIPGKVDWADPLWCKFANSRDRWLTESFNRLAETVRRNAAIPLFNNGAPHPITWLWGNSVDELSGQDLLGGDFRLIDMFSGFHLFAGISKSSVLYMNAFTGYIGAASSVIGQEEQFVENALYSLAFNSQFMAIDAIESNGNASPEFYEEDLRKVFDKMKPYEGLLGAGGKPVAEVGIYFSDASRMALAENGAALTDQSIYAVLPPTSPHVIGWVGASRALRINHLPVVTITKLQLKELSRFRVIVLPQVVRMSDEEIEAFKNYVQGGGNLYASGATSLLTPDGARKDNNFGLAEVFGCNLEGIDYHRVAYVHPQTDQLKKAIKPRSVVAHGAPRNGPPHPTKITTRVRPVPDVQVLATLDLPFSEEPGTREDHKFSSIHASPPYRITSNPIIIRRRFGKGEVIYSCIDLEGDQAPTQGGDIDMGATDYGPSLLFVEIIKLLLGDAPVTFRLEADLGVFAVAYDDSKNNRLQLNIANIPPLPPSRPVPLVKVTLSAPGGKKIKALKQLPQGSPLEFTTDAQGVVRTEIRNLEHLCVIAADYA